MSLDVYLYIGGTEEVECPYCEGKGRCTPDAEQVFESNITHNLNIMADAAGIYYALWRPDERGYAKAADLIKPLRDGLTLLKSDPVRFRKYDASNDWGTYDQFVPWVEESLKACETYPNADVHVSR